MKTYQYVIVHFDTWDHFIKEAFDFYALGLSDALQVLPMIAEQKIREYLMENTPAVKWGGWIRCDETWVALLHDLDTGDPIYRVRFWDKYAANS